jgi:hypothetical protein
MSEDPRRPTGHVFRVERKRGPVWYAKYRLPDGRQVQRKLGPAWTQANRWAAPDVPGWDKGEAMGSRPARRWRVDSRDSDHAVHATWLGDPAVSA